MMRLKLELSIKILFLCISIAGSIESCTSVKEKNKDGDLTLDRYYYVKEFPMDKYYGSEKFPVGFFTPDTNTIITDGKWTLVRSASTISENTGKLIVGSNPLFLFSDTSKYGYYLNNYNYQIAKAIEVDSILNKYRSNISANKPFDESTWQFHPKLEQMLNDTLLSYYTNSKKIMEMEADTLKVAFVKNKGEKLISLWPHFDSLGKGDVVGVYLKTNSFFSKIMNRKIPSYVISVALHHSKISENDPDFILFEEIKSRVLSTKKP